MSAALDSFVDKWLERWPQWLVLERFIETPQREISRAWFSLLQEYENIVNIAGDPTPADAKLAWWVQELHDWSRQRSRHPLAKVLQPLPIPWSTLADVLPELIHARKQADDLQHARNILQPFAYTIADIENTLFVNKSLSESKNNSDVIISQLLAHRSHILGSAALPLAFDQINIWQEKLLDHWPSHPNNPRPRRLYATLSRLYLHAQLRRKKQSIHPLSVLWHGWRAAR